jgi:hypothetical protein
MSALEIIRARHAKFETVVDALGRTFTVKRLDASQRLKIQEWTESKNLDVLGTMMIGAAVREIDGNPVVFPKNRTDLDWMIRALEDEGLVACAEAYKKLDGDMSEEEKVDAAKN